jgi:hypothetical protein
LSPFGFFSFGTCAASAVAGDDTLVRFLRSEPSSFLPGPPERRFNFGINFGANFGDFGVIFLRACPFTVNPFTPPDLRVAVRELDASGTPGRAPTSLNKEPCATPFCVAWLLFKSARWRVRREPERRFRWPRVIPLKAELLLFFGNRAIGVRVERAKRQVPAVQTVHSGLRRGATSARDPLILIRRPGGPRTGTGRKKTRIVGIIVPLWS